MKIFLKILLAAIILVIAIKLSPVLFVAAMLGLLAATVLGTVGLSLFALLAAVLLAFALALSPIWIPVLLIVGLVRLFRPKEPNVVTT